MRETIKESLDRRYATREQLAAVREDMEMLRVRVQSSKSLLADHREELEEMRRSIDELRVTGSRLEELQTEIRLAGRRLAALESKGNENRGRVDQVASQVKEAARLATEGAQAIEGILQQQVLIRRDLDETVGVD